MRVKRNKIGDLWAAILLFLPIFGSGADYPAAVSLMGLTSVHSWVKIVFLSVIGVTVLNGVCGVILVHFDRPLWNRHRVVTGISLSVIGVSVFIAARQPYAGIIIFALLVIIAIFIHKAY